MKNYELSDSKAVLHGTEISLDDVDSPTFVGIRQRDFDMEMSVNVSVNGGEGGVTVFMCESEHYDIALRKSENGFEAVLKLNIGDIKHIQNAVKISSGSAKLIIRSDSVNYNFYISENGKETHLGSGQSKYLSSEVSGGFTGVVLGLYAVGNNTAEFSELEINYN